jgi:AcrR family transcriptional regulator
MDSKTNSIFQIIRSALSLFQEKGFDATSIREIASASGVSLGMVNHYFGNKEFLGTKCLELLSEYAMSGISSVAPLEEDPILNDLLCVRALYKYLTLHGYELFYQDSLKNDFFFKRISKYAAGSTLFIDYAIQYLIESEVYTGNQPNGKRLVYAHPVTDGTAVM